MDWKDGLQAFLANNPDLPRGEESAAEPTEPTEAKARPYKASKLKVTVERKGHRGKTVTIIEGFDCDEETLAEIASRLKRHLGTGGSARGGEILVQGDRRAEVTAWLKNNE